MADPVLFGPQGGILVREPQGRVFEEPLRARMSIAAATASSMMRRASAHRGETSTEYDDDLRRRSTAVRTFHKMRTGHAEIVAGLRRLKLPIMQARDIIVAGGTVPDMPSVQAAKRKAKRDRVKAAREEQEPGQPLDLNPDDDTAEDLAQADSVEMARLVCEANLWGAWDPAYQMRTPWRRVKREALTALDFGAAFFERRWEWRQGSLGRWLVTGALWFIPPETIPEGGILVDREGELLGIEQAQNLAITRPDGSKGWEFVRVVIPTADLVSVVNDHEGAGWDGSALLRSLHGTWRRHGYLTRVRVIDHVRRGAPPPIIELEDGWDPVTKDEAEDLAERMATGDQPERAWAVLTPKVRMTFLDSANKAPDLTGSIASEEGAFRAVFGSEFTTSGGGSLARADVQARYFDLSLMEVSDLVTSSFSDQVLTPTAMLNWPGIAPPRLRQYGVVPRDVSGVNALAISKAIAMTGDVMQAIHEALDLPPLSEDLVEKYNRSPMNTVSAIMPGSGSPFGQKPDDEADTPKPKPAPKDDEEDDDEADDAKAASGKRGGRGLVAALRRALGLAGPDPDSDPTGEAVRIPRGGATDPDDVEGAGGLLGVPTWREPTARERRFMNLARIHRAFERTEAEIRQDLLPIRDKLVEEAVKRLKVEGTRVIAPGGSLPSKDLKAALVRISDRMRQEGRDRLAAEIKRQREAADAGEEIGLATPRPRGLTAWARRRVFRTWALDMLEVVNRVDDEIATAIEINVSRIIRSIADASQDALLDALLDPDITTEDEARDEAARKVKDKGAAVVQRGARDVSSRSYNGGRAEELADQQGSLSPDLVIERARRTEAVESPTICDVCRKMDGTVVAVDSPEFWRVSPPGQGDARCSGGTYCRGQMDPVLERASAAAG